MTKKKHETRVAFTLPDLDATLLDTLTLPDNFGELTGDDMAALDALTVGNLDDLLNGLTPFDLKDLPGALDDLPDTF